MLVYGDHPRAVDAAADHYAELLRVELAAFRA
jgi:hypothetical protein